MNTEKTGFEATQNLPISDKEIRLILDCLQDQQKALYAVMKENSYSLPKSAKDNIMERISEITILIDKLQLT